MQKGLSQHVSSWPLFFAALLVPSLPARSAALLPQSAPYPSGVPAADLSVPPVRWAEAAAVAEERIVNYDVEHPLRYRFRHVDARGEVLREVIESSDGPVARLLSRNGQPLTTAEDAAERERLQALLTNPADFFRHQHREAGSRNYATELLRAMPHAMLWTYVPGQPQLPGAARPAIVLDFKPDPQFKPPSLITEGLTGVAGRLWIDPESHVVTRIQGKVLQPVDFGWGGVFARIREGGTVELEQSDAGNGRWLFSHLVQHLTIREVLFHTVDEDSETTATNVQLLTKSVPYRTAIQMLLAIPVPTR